MNKMPTKDELLQKLRDSVIEQDLDAAEAAAKEALDFGLDPQECIQEGLYVGLKAVCDEYEKTVFPTEMIIASDAFYAGLNILKSKISKERAEETKKGTAVIGVVQGDIHDLGKNMVKYLMEAEGFEIIDLGFDVSAETFVAEAEKAKADLILISTMLTSLYPQITKIIGIAKTRGVKAKIMAGGGPVTEETAMKARADGWAFTAPLAVKKALELVEPMKKVMKVRTP